MNLHTFITPISIITSGTGAMSRSHTVTTIQAAVRWVAYGFLTSLSVPLVMAKTSVVATAVTMETVKVIACTYRQGT